MVCRIAERLIGKLLALAILHLLALPLAAQAQRQHSATEKSIENRRASDSHSFMELFNKLERDWGLAVQKKDRAFLDSIVAPEFIERDAADPRHTITRSEWMDKNLANYTLDPLSVQSMTIRAFLGNAVVSFVQKQTVSDSSTPDDYFIVDLWVTNNGQWRVASRFICTTAGRR